MAMPNMDKLKQLRQAMAQENIDAYIVPREDEHQGEYVGPHTERLQWLTGFNGSAGVAIVLKNKAALFVDGRYTLQAQQQVNQSCFDVIPIVSMAPSTWVSENLDAYSTLAFDPWLITEHALKKYQKKLENKSIQTIPLSQNLIDLIWDNRPLKPVTPVYVHPLKYAGQRFEDKLHLIAQELKKKKTFAAVITPTESVNWLFNIRGNDLQYVPTTFAYALVYDNGKADLFIDKIKLSQDILTHFNNHVTIKPFESFNENLKTLGHRKLTLLIDPLTAPVQAINTVEKAGGIILRENEPTTDLKCCKTAAELEGMRQSHIRDGAALTKFLHWISIEAPKGTVHELQAADKLLNYRKEFTEFTEPSFKTISATGLHGAIVHYRPDEKTNRRIDFNDIYLVDSGGQYIDGSTDVTRTVAIGKATPEQKDRFTRVLKGHIALASAIFPAGTSGSQLDILARQYLWQSGLDYAHGTGHGVGSVLNIHEGPQRISSYPSFVSLKPGMVLSNEPGYYKTGEYGIRIESIMIVKSLSIPGSEQEMLGFETITLAPIDTSLIEVSSLTEEELKWLNAYHQEVYDKLSRLLTEEVRAWLFKVTRPLYK